MRRAFVGDQQSLALFSLTVECAREACYHLTFLQYTLMTSLEKSQTVDIVVK